ncbi:MAG: hypothetical protein AAB423_02410 [Patescibacteria group bacterium]
MFDWFSNLFGFSDTTEGVDRATKLSNDFMRHEARIGGKLFGPVPRNRRREFFCLDSHTWIWHEEWLDANGQDHYQTTRYEIRPDGVVKAQDGQMQYQKVGSEELRRLIKAAKIYEAKVSEEIYQPIFQS